METGQLSNQGDEIWCHLLYLGVQHYCNILYLKWDERRDFFFLRLFWPFSVFKGGNVCAQRATGSFTVHVFDELFFFFSQTCCESPSIDYSRWIHTMACIFEYTKREVCIWDINLQGNELRNPFGGIKARRDIVVHLPHRDYRIILNKLEHWSDWNWYTLNEHE